MTSAVTVTTTSKPVVVTTQTRRVSAVVRPSSITITPAMTTVKAAPQLNSTVTIPTCTQGPPGIPGDLPSVIAATDLAGHRVIAADADGCGVYADYRSDSARSVLGVSTGACQAGGKCPLLVRGLLTWPAGGLLTGQPVLLGEDGVLVQSVPLTHWLRQIGFAIDADTISIDIAPAYYLGD